MGTSHDDDAGVGVRRPANRLGLDYRAVPPRRTRVPIVDFHTHVHDSPTVGAFLEAAELYGIRKIVTMTPLDELARVEAIQPGRLAFIAIPRWRSMAKSAAFQAQWLADLHAFAERGARCMKFWVAPPLRGTHGLTLEDPFFRPLIAAGLELNLDFMVHVGDPDEWFAPGGRYADRAKFGAKREHYRQLEFLLERVAPRRVIAAHLGGYGEEPDFLQALLDRHANLMLDSSATKWVVRVVARQPARLREFLIRNQDRVLFGSDLVVGGAYDFEHYASRYWVHQQLWETANDGESPIEDPDAPAPPRLRGLDLPADALEALYFRNAARLGYG
jgi:predicted TIM-barrel fold metal-dependent hydrolase